MANDLAADPDRPEPAPAASGPGTESEAGTPAPQNQGQSPHPEQHRVLELVQTLDWDPTWDYKPERSRD